MTFWVSAKRGPSPRVRGSLGAADVLLMVRGSIPACAGKPERRQDIASTHRVHPRVCGEALRRVRDEPDARGPSPRVRGSRGGAGAHGRQPGSIPACAGKPGRLNVHSLRSRVHPRVCGEARDEAAGQDHRRGSIPACAGKPSCATWRAARWRVHPRVCGEAASLQGGNQRYRGPSPRVRGSHGSTRMRQSGNGSIPACAGKPCPSGWGWSRRRVHPRVCGEAICDFLGLLNGQGPSPRVRGSLRLSCRPHRRRGSIPACAGKPHSFSGCFQHNKVHPRVCGEARSRAAHGSPDWGPSPRVRGSRLRSTATRSTARSIPACAGKPTRPRRTTTAPGVHPRVCGEASTWPWNLSGRQGPSPRVRGSHVPAYPSSRFQGSIPACAGKPASSRRRGCS